jgi:branched-chain amino acid transport system permease protein
MTKLLQLLASGAALGAVYALVGLGFVVIYRATGVINFAQAGMVVLGAFLVYNATSTWNLPFWLAVIVSMGIGAVIGIVLERFILRRMIGQPVYAVILVTVGLLLLVEPIVTTIWRNPGTNIENPWGLSKLTIGNVNLLQVDLATVALAAIVLGSFFLFFRYTKYGVAMRATAIDQEAALAQGIEVRRIVALSWAIAGAVAVIAGAMLGAAAGPGVGLGVGIGIVSLKALPAVVLGGLDSPLGAVVGGLVIGIAELLTAGYQADILPFLPRGFAAVMPWVVMLVVLLVRPFGLFGTRDVRRV